MIRRFLRYLNCYYMHKAFHSYHPTEGPLCSICDKKTYIEIDVPPGGFLFTAERREEEMGLWGKELGTCDPAKAHLSWPQCEQGNTPHEQTSLCRNWRPLPPDQGPAPRGTCPSCRAAIKGLIINGCKDAWHENGASAPDPLEKLADDATLAIHHPEELAEHGAMTHAIILSALREAKGEIMKWYRTACEVASEKDREIKQAMKLLNPANPEEDLQGAIRNLQQAHISWKESAETSEAELARLRAALRAAQQQVATLRKKLYGDSDPIEHL